MTPDEIASKWSEANAIYGFDPITGDATGETALHNLECERDAINENVAGLIRVRDECPSFFDAFDYDWAFEPSVYRRALEANLQTRAVQLLAMLHRNPTTPSGFAYSNVVVRYTFQSSTDPCTPFHAPHSDAHFIVAPFSFLEFVLLLTRAFLDSAGAARTGWKGFLNFEGFPKKNVSPFLRQAVLRALTTDAFHSSFTGESPIDAAKAKSAWFAEAAETGDVSEGVEVPLTYALTDFALAHELGHVLHGHKGLAREPDLRLQREQDADVTGFALYNSSWGWRDELMDPCPLNQGPRILLGPLLFHLFIRWHLAIRLGLATRALRNKEAAGRVNAQGLKSESTEAEARSAVAFQQLGHYEAQIRNRGAAFTEQDAKLYHAIAKAGSEFALHIVQATSEIPEEDYAIAQSLGDPGF